MTINVKEKSDGNFVYSFSAEAQEGSSTPQTLHAVVSDDKVTANAQPSKPIIHQNEPVVNTSEKENVTKHDIDETRYSIATKKKVMANLKENKAREERRAAKNYIGEEIKHARKDSFVEFARGVVDFKVGNNGYSADIIVGTTKSGAAVLYDIVNIQGKEITADTSYTAQDRRSNASTAINNSIPQNESIVNTDGEKNITKHDLAENGEKTVQEAKKADKGTVESKTEKTATKSGEDGKAAEKSSESNNESAENAKGETKREAKSSEPKVSEAKESLTDEQRKEKARKRAEAWLEWEKKTAPTAKELNTARDYVKGFDNLSNPRRLAIIRMIRSADGKVGKKILKGVANLLAITPKADIEIRFAEGIGNGGLYTHVGIKRLSYLIHRQTTKLLFKARLPTSWCITLRTRRDIMTLPHM